MTESTTRKLPLEDWEPKNPLFMLITVIVFMVWSYGIFDLLNHESNPPILFGRYSPVFFAFILIYSLGLIPLGILLVNERLQDRVLDAFAWVQDRLWRVVAAFVFIAVAIFYILEGPRWPRTPGLQLVALVMTLLMLGTLVLYRYAEYGRSQRWRRLVIVPVLALLAFEGAAQAAAWMEQLPPSVDATSEYVHWGRIYQTGEGNAVGRANADGWHYPEFRFEPDARRVVVLGDSFVRALQIAPDQHMGVALEQMLADGASQPVEVMGLGHNGFGPALYFDRDMLEYVLMFYEPDEIVVLFDLGSDFQIPADPTTRSMHRVLDDGSVERFPASHLIHHDLQHHMVTAYETVQPLRIARSYLLTPKLLGAAWKGAFSAPTEAATGALGAPFRQGIVTNRSVLTGEEHRIVRTVDIVERPGSADFVFEQADNTQAQEAMTIARYLLRTGNRYLKNNDVTLRLVTIPVFPTDFYEQNSGAEWSAELGAYDLLKPEASLREFAAIQEIPFLGMGQLMQSSGLSVEEMQSLYFNNGVGHLTPEGHRFFAEAIYRCLFADEISAECQ